MAGTKISATLEAGKWGSVETEDCSREYAR
jgi:hypothetical protein